MFFSRVVVAFALAASMVAAQQEYNNLSARELQEVAAHFQRRAAIAEVFEVIEGGFLWHGLIICRESYFCITARAPAKIVTTRYCNGPAIMEKKTDEHGKVISNDVHQVCSPPAT